MRIWKAGRKLSIAIHISNPSPPLPIPETTPPVTITSFRFDSIVSSISSCKESLSLSLFWARRTVFDNGSDPGKVRIVDCMEKPFTSVDRFSKATQQSRRTAFHLVRKYDMILLLEIRLSGCE